MRWTWTAGPGDYDYEVLFNYLDRVFHVYVSMGAWKQPSRFTAEQLLPPEERAAAVAAAIAFQRSD